MTENPETPDSRSPTAEHHEPHRAGIAGQSAASSPNTEQQREGKTIEWPGDCDDWDDELDEDRDRFEVPDGWDEDEPHHAEQPDDEVDGLEAFDVL